MIRSRNIIAIPPGATIREQLQDRNLSQKEFAVRMNMSEKHISKLINGEVQLTVDVAVRLETVLGVPAKFWNNLEAIYREKIIKATAENEMETDIEIAKRMPYNEMAKLGWVPDAKKQTEQVISLRKYFEVVRLELLNNSQVNRIACRRSGDIEKEDYTLIAWAQRAKIEARKIKTKKINLERVSSNLSEICSMITKESDVVSADLVELLAENGIALVLLPYMKDSVLHGATFYDGNKIVIGLTAFEEDINQFRFNLFHELAHVLYGHIGKKEGTSTEDEECADRFAKEILTEQ